MQQEHPFAQYIRILGKGKKGSRGLSREEAYAAMKMILAGEVEECQLGAFLMLLRVKEETPEEVAGFVEATRETFTLPEELPQVTLDWSSYAGKRRHLPWYLLSALLLADNGVSVFMHGAEGHTEGRIYARESLKALGLPVAESFEQAGAQLRENNFAYLPLEFMSPLMHRIIQMRPLLGLRSPVHTVARMFNPFNAPYVMQGIFHPSYRDTHQHAGKLLQQPHLTVIKGEGGEIERNPDQPCLVKSLHDGELSEAEWPAMFTARHVKAESMDVSQLVSVWQGEAEDEYGVAAVIGTTAIALDLLGKAKGAAAAQALAEQMWQQRNLDKFTKAA